MVRRTSAPATPSQVRSQRRNFPTTRDQFGKGTERSRRVFLKGSPFPSFRSFRMHRDHSPLNRKSRRPLPSPSRRLAARYPRSRMVHRPFLPWRYFFCTCLAACSKQPCGAHPLTGTPSAKAGSSVGHFHDLSVRGVGDLWGRLRVESRSFRKQRGSHCFHGHKTWLWKRFFVTFIATAQVQQLSSAGFREDARRDGLVGYL